MTRRPHGLTRSAAPAVLAGTLALLLAHPAGAAAEVALRVDGLACPFCAYGIEKKILAVPGVAGVDVLLDEGFVVAVLQEDAPFDPSAFARAVDDAGFTLRATFLRDAVGTLRREADGRLLLRGIHPRARFRLRFPDDTALPEPSGEVPLRVAVTGELEDASGEPFPIRVQEIRALPDRAPVLGEPR